MARLRDTILGQRGYGLHANAPMVDLKQGGQQGPMPNYPGYVSNSAYVRRNIIAVLVEAPVGFRLLEDPQLHIETLKALVELHPKSIEGLQNTLTVEHVENAVGGGGEMQEDVSNVTRSRSTPTFVWTEKYGMPVNAFFSNWITSLIMDPETKFPTAIAQGQIPFDLLPDFNGMTVLFFEPDPTHTKVLKAWLCTNMRPKTSGEVSGRRDMTQGGESVDYSIEFTALTQHGVGVRRFAESILNSMNLAGMNPNMQRSHIESIDPYVDPNMSGYGRELENNAQTRVA